MRVASSLPHPYLVDRAGAVCLVNEFYLQGDHINVVPANREILAGTCFLIYRCSNHESFDIRRAIEYNGKTWLLAERVAAEGGDDICYPGPLHASRQPV